MSKRYTAVVILCEDRRTFSFVKQFLEKRGVDPRRIRSNMNPKGKGSGAQYVLKKFAGEVREFRRRHTNCGLLAVIDCDNTTFRTRMTELENALLEDGQKKCDQGEAISRLAPKRNIETWIYCLLGNPVTEDENYKHKVTNDQIKPAVTKLARECPQQIASYSDLPSLVEGCRELVRFLAVQKR